MSCCIFHAPSPSHSVSEFSAHTAHLAVLVAIVSERAPEVGAAVLQRWPAKFNAGVRSGQGVAARILFRFLAELVAAYVVPVEVTSCLSGMSLQLPPAVCVMLLELCLCVQAFVAQFMVYAAALAEDSALGAAEQDFIAGILISALCWVRVCVCV